MAKVQVKNKPPVKTPVSIYNYAGWILALLAIVCYFPVLNLDLTQLDDTVFIRDKHNFISHFSNITTAFTQGAFNEQDIYYRPMLLVYFILVCPFTSRTSITAFHFGNLFFHLLNVFLVYKLFNKLTGNKKHSFWLAAFFAAHPALTMAVTWIPGINDLLLTAFALGYFLTLLKIYEEGKWKHILLNTLFLLLALFTKETGAFLPAGGFLLLWYKKYLKLNLKKFSPVITLNIFAWMIWFLARKNILPPETPSLINTEMFALVVQRTEGLLQYFGKCILPFNLNVFPTIESTNTIYGLFAVAIVGALIFLNKERNTKSILIGAGWFILFLLPIFFVPKNISNQLYEHRLYLPMFGILLLLRETILFTNKISLASRKIIVGATFGIFIILIHVYTSDFKDTFSFWNAAVAASPESPYANKLLGIKLTESKKEKEAIPYIRKAYELDSNERYTRLFLARLIFIPEQKWDSARYYLEREISVNPKFVDTYAELAHVCVEQKDFPAAEKNILKFLAFKPNDQSINYNLLLIYKDQGKYKEAMEQANNMRARGMEVNEALYKVLADSVQRQLLK